MSLQQQQRQRQEQLPGGTMAAGPSAGKRSRGGDAARRNLGYVGVAAQSYRLTGVPARTVDITALLGRRLNDVEDKNAPPVVHTMGPMEIPVPEPKVSVIGSRRCPASGLAVAHDMSRALAEAGATVVSGLAPGVDAAAHRGAIDAGGCTVAVIGTPLDMSYPAANTGLWEEIVRGHLVVSQFAAGSPVMRSNFVRRSKTMALLSDATVIAGAASSSGGTRHQGWESIRLGRPLFIHQSVMSGPSEVWAKEMLEYGATLVDGPAPVIDGIPPGIKMPEIFPRT